MRIQSLRGATYQSVLVPLDALLLVGIRVRVTLDGTSVATEQTVQSRTDLVAAASLNGVALGATGLEEVGTLLSVTYLPLLVVVLKILLLAQVFSIVGDDRDRRLLRSHNAPCEPQQLVSVWFEDLCCLRSLYSSLIEAGQSRRRRCDS